MILHNACCDDDDFAALLEGSEDSARYQAAAKHLDVCEACRRRLTERTGDEAFWLAQQEMLRPQEGDEAESGTIYRYRSGEFAVRPRGWADEAVIKELLTPLLSSPSHPEMLGRLGRYEIERIIGAGGMGIVLKGYDSELNRPVAIKLLAPHLARVGAARQRFAREARAAAAVVHEHVVAIHNVETEHTSPFLVMQFIAGESLQARVDREGPLSVAEVLRIGMQAASGLAAAHAQGLVHRDVKPANILLEKGVERAYLTDFGLARASDDASLTYTGVVAGTPHYMSPEQADGLPLNQQSDLFSLGSVLYFMATGHPPFRAERPMAVLKRTCCDPHRPAWQVNPEIPEAFSMIIDRLLQKKPAARFSSAMELREALQETLSALQKGQLRYGPPRRVAFSKRLAVIGGCGAAVIGLVVGFGWLSGVFVEQKPPVTERSLKELREALQEADPSPAAKFRREVDEASRLLESLESSPFLENSNN